MIFEILFFILFGLLGVLLGWLPGWGQVPLLLPWGIDSVMVTAVSYYRSIIETVPYLEVLMQAFLYALGFELAMIVLKVFLGARVPGQSSN